MRTFVASSTLLLCFAAPSLPLNFPVGTLPYEWDDEMAAQVLGLAQPDLTAFAKQRFDCPKLNPVPSPQDISQLHPSHVSIVMAVGDSITTAFSARNGVLEDRDVSWSGGVGSARHLTLPWLLSQYSPQVDGAATRPALPVHILKLPHGDYHARIDHLNVAQSMAEANLNSLDEQWVLLHQNFGRYEDFHSRWKVLTVWMFANDVCGMCKYPTTRSRLYANWEKKVGQFLQNVTSTLNNTYVNLVSMLDLSHIHRIQQGDGMCKFMHEKLFVECGCIDRGSPEELAMLDQNIAAMNRRLSRFALDWMVTFRKQGRMDVAVVYNGFLEGIGPELDMTFLSRLDCFHPSARAHQDLAVGLWNSMLCTSDRGRYCGLNFTTGLKPVCPTVGSTFYVGGDSKVDAAMV